MCAGDGSKASILVRSWRPFRSWLGEKPVLSGVRDIASGGGGYKGTWSEHLSQSTSCCP